MHKEKSSEKRIRAYVRNRKPASALFRNDCGAGRMLLDNGSTAYVRYGLKPGSGDDVGWTSVEITPDMVGQRVAVFTSCEYKSLITGDSPSKEQLEWYGSVQRDGGIAEIWEEQTDGTIRLKEIDDET